MTPTLQQAWCVVANVVEKWKIALDTSEVASGAKQAGESIAGAFAKGTIAANLALKAVSLLTNAIGEAIDAAAENEKTNIRLSAALHASGQEVAKNSELLNKQADELERISGTSDEVIRALQTIAINYGSTADKASEYVRAAMALAQATGIDAKGALEALVKAQATGEVQMLKMIPGIANLTKEQIRNGDAMKVVSEKYGSFIDLENRGVSGAFNRIGTAIGNMAESMAVAVSQSGPFTAMMNSIATGAERIASGRSPFDTMQERIMGKLERKGATYKAKNYDYLDQKMDFSEEEAGEITVDLIALERRKKRAEEAKRDYERRLEKARSQKGTDYDAHVQVYLAELAEKQHERVTAIFESAEEKRTEIAREGKERRMALLEEEGEAKEDWINYLSNIESLKEDEKKRKENEAKFLESKRTEVILQSMAMIGSAASDLTQTLIEGGEVSGDAFFGNLLKSLGKYMVARGTGYVMEAGAMMIATLGAAAPVAGPLAAQGGLMIAFGAGLQSAGGSVSSGAGAMPSAGGGMDHGTPASGGGGGGGFRRDRGSGTTEGVGSITINVTGAVTEAGVGVMVDRALRKARQQRVI